MSHGSYPTSSQSILQHFPYSEARAVQEQLLEKIEQNWDTTEVFVIVAPTATGKTALIRTLQNWKYSVSAITPTNQLVDQFLQEFPDTRTLSRLDSYHCDEWQQPCSRTRARQRGFCRGCPCSLDLSQARFKRGPGIYNYHTYLAHKLYRPVLAVDEAHNLAHTIRDRQAITIWWHEYQYPINSNPHVLLAWLERQSPRIRKHKKIQLLHEALISQAPTTVIQHGYEEFNGAGTRRGQPEERPCLRLLPVDITAAPPMFWPRDVEKLVLLSATISPTDIRELGLDQRRVLYLEAASPIPMENRPVVFLPVATLSRGGMDEGVRKVGLEINQMAQHHWNEKGLVHATYQMADQLRSILTGPRFMFHTRENKRQVYQEFRNRTDAPILVASGMYEGIDLPDDLGRWQVVAKVPWKSLGDAAIRYKAERDPDWYLWQAMRDLVQACGRIVRHPTDAGVTYILDGSFRRLLTEGQHLIPGWFRDSLAAGKM